MVDKTAATSADTAEVKAKPAKVGAEEKILAGIKQAWLELKNSDKSWEQTGRKFGKWCSELRKLYKKPGSRKGKGFEATVKKLGVNYEKARYWADVVDGKIKPRYAGGAATKKTTTAPKADGPKPTPFTLVGVSEAEQDEIVKSFSSAPELYSRFIYALATDPGEKQVQFVVNLCLTCLSVEEQHQFLADLQQWINQKEMQVDSYTVERDKGVALCDENLNPVTQAEVIALRDRGWLGVSGPEAVGQVDGARGRCSMIETLDIRPVLTDEQLEALRLQPLTPAHFKPITTSTRVICEGKLKALFLKAEGEKPITQLSYDAALRGLRAMPFVSASHSRRPSVDQNFGGDLLLGWMNGYAPEREDIFRARHRDNFTASFWLVPMLKDFERAMAEYLPDYWQFHLSQAKQLVRPGRERLKTLHMVEQEYERIVLCDWDKKNRRYLFPGSEAFSTLTLNQNICFLAHKDGHNVPATLSCLTAAGAYAGGALGFPRLGISFDIQPRDLLIADTNEEYHGTVGGIFGNRYSVVAYLHESLLPNRRATE